MTKETDTHSWQITYLKDDDDDMSMYDILQAVKESEYCWDIYPKLLIYGPCND